MNTLSKVEINHHPEGLGQHVVACALAQARLRLLTECNEFNAWSKTEDRFEEAHPVVFADFDAFQEAWPSDEQVSALREIMLTLHLTLEELGVEHCHVDAAMYRLCEVAVTARLEVWSELEPVELWEHLQSEAWTSGFGSLQWFVASAVWGDLQPTCQEDADASMARVALTFVECLGILLFGRRKPYGAASANESDSTRRLGH